MHTIRIDTSELSYPWLWIPGQLPHFVDGSARDGASVRLPAGTFAFQQTRWRASDVRFSVTDDGVVDYPSTLEHVLAGRGTGTLRVRGLDVTFNPTGSGPAAAAALGRLPRPARGAHPHPADPARAGVRDAAAPPAAPGRRVPRRARRRRRLRRRLRGGALRPWHGHADGRPRPVAPRPPPPDGGSRGAAAPADARRPARSPPSGDPCCGAVFVSSPDRPGRGHSCRSPQHSEGPGSDLRAPGHRVASVAGARRSGGEPHAAPGRRT